jgi:hypothetical protein
LEYCNVRDFREDQSNCKREILQQETLISISFYSSCIMLFINIKITSIKQLISVYLSQNILLMEDEEANFE